MLFDCLFCPQEKQRELPKRAIQGIMMFTACWVSYMSRLQMPILVVPMIQLTAAEKKGGSCIRVNVTGEELHSVSGHIQPEALKAISPKDLQWEKRDRSVIDYWSNKPFNWEPFIRGQLLAGYGYGNIPGNLLGGLISMKFGPRLVILWASIITTIVILASPLLANIHWTTLVFARLIIGFAGGVTFPCCHSMVGKWAPPAEKARFVWSLLGGGFGTIVTYPMIGAIAEKINWESAWTIPGLIYLVWTVFWYQLAYDSPAEHPTISEEELNYITTAQGEDVSHAKMSKPKAPYKDIFTSVPFYSLVILHFGNLYLIFLYQNSMMLYITKVLGFQLTKGSAIASLPWLARIVFGFFFSWGGDLIKKKEFVSLTNFRKIATIFSHCLPGACLITVGYLRCNWAWTQVFLFLALGFNGAATISNLSNNQDLSPNHAGLLYGFMNTVGTLASVIVPAVAEEVAGKHGNTIEQWQSVFWIGAAVCLASMVVFAFFGTAKVQSWNQKTG